MRIERFADQYRLKLGRDECGEKVIPGRCGHLWFDGPDLCLTIIDGPPIRKSRLEDLIGPDGSVWQGEISPDHRGRRVQDAEVRGIRLERYRQAIRLVGCKPKRVLSEAQQAVLKRARAASRIAKPRAPEPLQPLERAGERSEGVRCQGRARSALDGPVFL